MVLPLIVAAGGAVFGALSEKYSWKYVPNYRDLEVVTTGNDDQMEQQALAIAKSYLITEEGRRDMAYLDSRGILTIGIGHALTANDGDWKVGDRITQESIDELFAYDISTAFNTAVTQAKEIKKYNAYMIARLTSVNFQLGTGWRSKFPNTWSLIKTGTPETIQKAINAISKSAWAEQTPNRALAFASTLQQQFIG